VNHSTAWSRFRVVLVRPTLAANIGSVARIMRNFGAADLFLVAPHADPVCDEAKKLSTHGESVLHKSRSVGSFGEAVGDCVLVVGTSARLGGLFRHQNLRTPNEAMPEVMAALASGQVAFVFGPEATGLTNEEVSRCHFLLTIPAEESYPVLNIAQAVAICLYELYQAWNQHSEPAQVQDIAPLAEQERLFEHLEHALQAIHFLWDERSAAQMHAIRHLLGRAKLSPMEAKILLGVARQIRWYVQNYPPTNYQPPPWIDDANTEDESHRD
jgi:tRNA/rRNA methyltransferase